MNQAKTIAILQSNYIPWKGYFDIIAGVDEFILYDEVQFTRRDWRNRNKIIIDGQPRWLTIPVASKGRFDSPIDEVEISDPTWAESHWNSVKHAYGKAAYFPVYGPLLKQVYESAATFRLLTQVNELFLRSLSDSLGAHADFQRSSIIPRKAETPTGRLVEICAERRATVYISGPAARSYINEAEFDVANVDLRYACYDGYPQYDQRTREFEHGVSVIDVLMRCGPEARGHLKSNQRPGGLFDVT